MNPNKVISEHATPTMNLRWLTYKGSDGNDRRVLQQQWHHTYYYDSTTVEDAFEWRDLNEATLVPRHD